jgi:hypothetical protein
VQVIWIINIFVIRPNPHPEVPTHHSYPRNAVS